MCEVFPHKVLWLRNAPGNLLSTLSKNTSLTHMQTTHTHTSIPLFLSLSVFCPFSPFTPISLARNTAPYFSWQNTAGRPCVPEKPANVHISYIFCLLSAHTSLQPPHIIQAPSAWDEFVLSLTLHPHPSLPPSTKPLHNSLSLHPNPSLWWFLALFCSFKAGQPCTGVRDFAA